MKNLQKGFIVPVLLAIIALLAIGGGVYIYEDKKVEVPILPDNTSSPNQNQNQNQQTNNQNNTSSFITILSPNGGISLQEGSTYKITWKASNLPTTAKIYVSLIKGFKGDIDYNDLSKNIVSGLSSTTTSYSWKVDTGSLGLGNDYTIVAVATWGDFDAGTFARTYDSSDANFIISGVTSEEASGIIKSVYTKSGKNYIDIDYVEFVSGGPNGVHVQNNNPQIRTLELSSNAKFIITSSATSSFSGSITFSDFQKYFTTSNTSDYHKYNPWDIVITNGVIIQIEEHFVP